MDDRVGATRKARPTSADVARLSGFSRATVSYVLNDTPNQSIPEATRARIHAAAEQLGYTPSATAAALRRGHSRVVLVVKDPALSGYITEPFLTAISNRLREARLSPLVTDLESEDALLTLAQELKPFGVVTLSPVTATLPLALAEAGVPHQYQSVVIGAGSAPRRPWEETIGALQAEHLLSTGSTHLLYLLPPAGSSRSALAGDRATGAQGICAAAGATFGGAVPLPLDRAEAATVLRGLLERSADRVGVCAFDDVVAATALAAAQDLRIPVPDRLSVVGVDDTPFAALMSPSLTTVRVDSVASGTRVAEAFLAGRGNEHVREEESTLALVVRQSTPGTPAAS